MAPLLIGLAVGLLIGALWRWRQWRAYRRALEQQHDETKFRRAFYAYCRERPDSNVTTAPGARVID